MENNLPSENFRPEDEYPELDEQPIEAAEPDAGAAEETAAQPQSEPADSEPVQETQAAEPQSEPPFVPPVQQYPRNGVTYYPQYPMYPPAGGVQYPQQGMPQQPSNGAPYYPPYPMYPQQPYVQPPYGQQPYPQQPYPQQPYVQPPYPQHYPQQPQGFAPQAMPPQHPGMPPQGPAPAGNSVHYPVHETVPERKKSSSTGTKAFLLILSALLLAMVAGFIAYIANASAKDAEKKNKEDEIFSEINNNDNRFFGDLEDSVEELKHTEFEEEIKLVPDNGATQMREDDNPDSVGKPDKNAKGIELKDAPKDADDSAKYTAKSSFNTLVDSVVTISCYEGKISENIYDITSGGSGTIISADGYIITNAHVLYNSRKFAVNVTLNNGDSYPAKIIGYDTWTDLAVLKIDAKDLKPAEFADSEKVEVGDDVIAIGSPGGAKYQNSLTQGVISAVDREISVNKCVRYIQSDADINPGSSGGPLCNYYGQVIGITTAKTVAENYENMSFSIPSAIVKEIVTDLIHYGYVPDRARIGFSGTPVSADEKLYYGIPSGLIIDSIADDGALKDTDLKKGDIITAVDGEEIGSFQDVYNILAKHKPGDKVKLSVYRLDEELLASEKETESK